MVGVVVPATAALNDRAMEFPDGDVGLDLEPGDGDVYYAVSEVSLERAQTIMRGAPSCTFRYKFASR